MLKEKLFDTQNCYVYMEFKNVAKELVPWLENLAQECRCRVEKKEWKSKYNHYVIYDYEPFCAEGFEITITLSSKYPEFLNFISYLYDRKLQIIDHLNNCILI